MTRSRGRPSTAPIRKNISFDQPMLNGIDAYRIASPDKMSEAEAIRRIIRDWLTGQGFMSGGDDNAGE